MGPPLAQPAAVLKVTNEYRSRIGVAPRVTLYTRTHRLSHQSRTLTECRRALNGAVSVATPGYKWGRQAVRPTVRGRNRLPPTGSPQAKLLPLPWKCEKSSGTLPLRTEVSSFATEVMISAPDVALTRTHTIAPLFIPGSYLWRRFLC